MFLTADNKEIESKVSPDEYNAYKKAYRKEIIMSLYAKSNPFYLKKTKEWKNILLEEFDKKKLEELDKKRDYELEKKFILTEFDFAKDFHKGEKRRDNKEYYLVHTLEVVLGSKFNDKKNNKKTLTKGVLGIGLKPDHIGVALVHDTLESVLERHKNVDRKILYEIFKKDHKEYFKNAFSEYGYEIIKKHIQKVENLIVNIFTFDKEKDNYFSYIEKFFKKNYFIFTEEKGRDKRKILRDMLETQIIKAQDKSVSNYELLNQTKLQKIKSAYKTIYTANRFKSFVLRNKKKLSEFQLKQINMTLKDLTRSSIAATERVTTELNKKYEKDNHMLKRFTELEILVNKYEKINGFKEITMPKENAKWNNLGAFDGILYNMYRFITSEKKKAMKAYFKNIKNNQERHTKILAYNLCLKKLAEKLDNSSFVVDKFNYKYFQKIDKKLKEDGEYYYFDKKKDNNIFTSGYNKLVT